MSGDLPTPAPKPRFLRACAGEPVDVTPIWMMRQAGRVFPRYRALRERYGFTELVRHPDLMAEVTLMPVAELGVDAAVMFADIMLPLAALGIEFDITESGPVVASPIRTPEHVAALVRKPVADVVPEVFAAVRAVRSELDGVPLIGFSGAPFTLASYVIEGGRSREYAHTKSFMLTYPDAWDDLLGRLSDMVIEYVGEKVAAGAQALQLFDSWIGALGPADVERYVLPHTRRIFASVADLGVPRIHFGTNTASLLELMAAPDCEVVSVDWRVRLDEAWKRIGDDRAIQGNLDPAVLLGPRDVIRERARDVLREAAGRPGHIFNLGHGVLPGSALDDLKLLVDTVHEGL